MFLVLYVYWFYMFIDYILCFMYVITCYMLYVIFNKLCFQLYMFIDFMFLMFYVIKCYILYLLIYNNLLYDCYNIFSMLQLQTKIIERPVWRTYNTLAVSSEKG